MHICGSEALLVEMGALTLCLCFFKSLNAKYACLFKTKCKYLSPQRA